MRYRCIWFTGLSAAGKSTLAEALCLRLWHEGLPSKVIDGDVLRNRFPERGFSKEDRIRHNLSIAQSLNIQAHSSNSEIYLVATINPFQVVRDWARFYLIGYFEVYVSTPLDVCRSRDPKGLYRRAEQGLIRDFTGLHQIYEIPISPNLIINTDERSVEDCIDEIMLRLVESRF